MSEKPFDICDRTFDFSQRIVKLCSFLNQQGYESRDISRQLIRSGTSIGAIISSQEINFYYNNNESYLTCREATDWLRLIIASELVSENRLVPLLNETNELIKIIASIIVKTKGNRKK